MSFVAKALMGRATRPQELVTFSKKIIEGRGDASGLLVNMIDFTSSFSVGVVLCGVHLLLPVILRDLFSKLKLL